MDAQISSIPILLNEAYNQFPDDSMERFEACCNKLIDVAYDKGLLMFELNALYLQNYKFGIFSFLHILNADKCIIINIILKNSNTELLHNMMYIQDEIFLNTPLHAIIESLVDYIDWYDDMDMFAIIKENIILALNAKPDLTIKNIYRNTPYDCLHKCINGTRLMYNKPVDFSDQIAGEINHILSLLKI